MDNKIEIKEEDPLTYDIASQNEGEFLHKVVSMKTHTVAVLLDADCDITVKREVKSETPFIKHFVKQIETETATCCNNCEIDRTNEVKQQPLLSDVASQNKGNFHPEHAVIMDKKYNSDHEMCNKIEIKEEPWQLETETSSVWDNTIDVDIPAIKSSRFSPETVDGAIPAKSPLLSAELKAKDTSLYNGLDDFEFEYQKSDVTETLTAKEDVHSDKYVKCSVEDDMYMQPLYLKRKSLTHVGKRVYQCSTCAKTFPFPSQLKVHILIHEGKKPHNCKVCNKRFTQLGHLKTHYLIHDGKKAYQCKVCDKRFTQSSTLRTHNLIHEGKKSYQCKVCDKSFTQLSTLRRHNIVHEDAKPHQCKLCDKSFTRVWNLKTHYLIHEGKRPYQCRVCDKSFTGLSDLRTHNSVHEGKKPYQCKVCYKRFTRLWNLKTHDLIHEGRKPYQCKVCDKSFTQLSILKRHNLVHEGKKHTL